MSLFNRSRAVSTLVIAVLVIAAAMVTAAAVPAETPPATGMTVEEAREMIARNGHEWIAVHTSVSDIPWDQFKKRLGLIVPPGFENRHKVNLAPGSPGSPFQKGELPSSWDWREHEGITPVKDQGDCGSCWAFCSIGAIEACARIHDHEIYDLSEQQMLDCNAYGYGCGGGEMSSCYEIFQSYGAVSEEEIPYRAANGTGCRQGDYQPLAKISSWFYLEETVESIKAAIYAYGPVVSAMTVWPEFTSYGGGCYVHPSGGELNHGILIVGWDDNLCGGAWICKNSWNTGWGDQGFFTIRYGSADIGSHAAAIIHTPRLILSFDHVPPETTTRPNASPVLEAAITSNLAPIDPDSVLLSYRVDGGDFVETRMEPSGEPNTWRAQIPSLVRPAEVHYFIRAVDEAGHSACRPAGAPGTCFAFDLAYKYDCFEGDSTGWTVGDPDDDATSGLWQRVVPLGTTAQPDSDCTLRGSACWVTGQHAEGDADGADDVDGGKTTLVSPRYELYGATTARVKYARWYSNDRGAAPGEDEWLVQARNNDGDWVDVERTSESSNAWTTVVRNLFELFDEEPGAVQFRFIASDEGRGSSVEAAIDNFTLLADPDTTVVAWAAAGPGYLVSRAWPNPMRTEARIRLQIMEETHGSARIYAADGRFVASIFEGDLDRKRHELIWRGQDDEGRAVPSGVYYCLLDFGGKLTQMPLVLIR